MKHTKGTWRYNEKPSPDYTHTIREVKSEDGISICIIRTNNSEQAQANGRLIASAPELLNTLRAVTLSLRAHPDNLPNSEFEVMIDRAIDVIEKATGE